MAAAAAAAIAKRRHDAAVSAARAARSSSGRPVSSNGVSPQQQQHAHFVDRPTVIPVTMTVPPMVVGLPKMEDGPRGADVDMGGPSSATTFDGEEDVEVKKAMRAERNRQSAAASRERKKHHIKELERRVAVLSQENAQLQFGQLKVVVNRIEKERKLLEENKALKTTITFKNWEIKKLNTELKSLKPPSSSDASSSLKRPNTWDASQWNGRDQRDEEMNDQEDKDTNNDNDQKDEDMNDPD